MSPISRGFMGRRHPAADPSRVPPGQYLTDDFPVLSAGPTPHTSLEEWTFTIHGALSEPISWPWDEFLALPSETLTVDIHCVTKWSKLDTSWRGVSVDTLLEGIETEAEYLSAWSDGDYSTNLALEDVTDGKAWVVYEYDGQPLEPEHGGPARLLVPHLYFWRSAQWVRGLTLMLDDEPGFWEGYGYHNHGDPWLEPCGPIGGYFVWEQSLGGRCCWWAAAQGSSHCGRCFATGPPASANVLKRCQRGCSTHPAP